PEGLSGAFPLGRAVQGFEFDPTGSSVVYLSDQGDGRCALFSVAASGRTAPLELAREVASSFRIHPARPFVLYAADHGLDERFALHGRALDAPASVELSAP